MVNNPGGSQSTERLIGIDDPDINGGRPTLIPTLYVEDGKIKQYSSVTKTGEITVSREQQRGAIKAAIKSGLEYPSFRDHDKATEFAKQRSKDGGIKSGPLGRSRDNLGE